MPEIVSSRELPTFPESGVFMVKLEARASFRVRRELTITLHNVMGDGRRVDLIIATEYDDASGLPRPIILATVTLTGVDLNEAGTWATAFVRGYLQALAVASNAVVDDAKVVHAVDVSVKSVRREFYQSQSEIIRQALPSETRLIDYDASVGFAGFVIDSRAPGRDRICRAMQQYVLALRYWTVETKVLAVGHVFMAVEALTLVAKGSLGLSDADLFALEKGISGLKYSRRVRDESNAADAYARRMVTFDGDRKTLKGAKTLSDGLEHGYGNYEELIALADTHGDRTLFLVRRAILKLSGLADHHLAALTDQRFVAPLPLFAMFSVYGTVPEPQHLSELGCRPLDMSDVSVATMAYDEPSGMYHGEMSVRPIALRPVSVEGFRFRP